MVRVRIRVRITFSVLLVSCYVHVFVLLQVVMVTLPMNFPGCILCISKEIHTRCNVAAPILLRSDVTVPQCTSILLTEEWCVCVLRSSLLSVECVSHETSPGCVAVVQLDAAGRSGPGARARSSGTVGAPLARGAAN